MGRDVPGAVDEEEGGFSSYHDGDLTGIERCWKETLQDICMSLCKSSFGQRLIHALKLFQLAKVYIDW